MTIQQEIITKLLREFPKAATQTLARVALKDHPSVFKNLQSTRMAIRKVRGAAGVELRDRTSLKDLGQFEPLKAPGDPFPKLPQGKTHFEDWQPFVIDGPARALILADTHIPYHDREAIITAVKWGKARDVDTVILNGDIADFFSVSFWEKDPRKRRFADELQVVKSFMAELRSQFPKARIVYKIGNHEERWERYMFVKAPELLGVPEFEIKTLLGLEAIGIKDVIGDKRPLRLGHLNILHGHEYRFAISNPVNPARGLFLRTKAYAMCGHFHQSSQHSDRSVEQKNIGTWSTGCLCDLHPDFLPLNNWNHGFAFVEVEADGKFQVQNKFIAGGKVY